MDEGVVGVQQLPFLVDAEDEISGIVKNVAVALLAFAQLDFGLFEFGDVSGNAHGTHNLSIVVADERGAQQAGKHLAFAGDVFDFSREGSGLLQRFAHQAVVALAGVELVGG